MKNTTERRQQILEYLLENRVATRSELSNTFKVSLRTIERDVLVLSCSHPIITMQGGAGGIRIADGYRLGKKYLTTTQTALLEKLSQNLEGEDLVTMKEILRMFRQPIIG